MNFVTDLFGTRENDVTEDPIWDLDSGQAEESGLEFGFGPGLGSRMGLRVVGLDSESDSDEFEVNSGFVNNDDDNYDGFGASNNNYHASENEREEFDWEEVSERIHIEERENLNSLINRIEEISVSSNISTSEGENSSLGDDEGAEEEHNLEWEVLLAVNNLERALEEENNNSGSEGPRTNLHEDYILAMEYDALFGQLVEDETALKGSPPAAKSVVENLPWMVFTKEDVGENNNSICAVCKDEFTGGEKLTRMPCCHLYHGDCILPWLSMRNTCPLCRYELPTDDADYERRRNERVGNGMTTRMADDRQSRTRVKTNSRSSSPPDP
ncbi:Anaphase-promoting complex (APC), subunit 11 [Handroanthus impetiginosus]|uniref:RING-type E3 ubiquitin transferase n=1 Tax=Handroanthus impetiginosus TaxID=429701 RepID=A0A2G9G247_9LAMI|nr:Anaphase-promoting complex (APC), subunit 11 [Handroanthus impetiginosus]